MPFRVKTDRDVKRELYKDIPVARFEDRSIAAQEAQYLRNCPHWRNLRKLILSKHPKCADPFGDHVRLGRSELAVEVHHIEPLTKAPWLAYTRSNLMPLCRGCHEKIEPKGKQNVK